MIIKLYPFAILAISVIINLLLGLSPLEVSVPSDEIVKVASISAILLVANHSWIMTSTELTRLRYKIYASPEEWKDSGLSKENVTEEGGFEIDRHLNTHRNTTENTVYYIFAAILIIFVSPAFSTACVWILMFPIARLGYTYSYFTGKDNVRGIFMSLTLLSVYGMSSYLALGLIFK